MIMFIEFNIITNIDMSIIRNFRFVLKSLTYLYTTSKSNYFDYQSTTPLDYRV